MFHITCLVREQTRWHFETSCKARPLLTFGVVTVWKRNWSRRWNWFVNRKKHGSSPSIETAPFSLSLSLVRKKKGDEIEACNVELPTINPPGSPALTIYVHCRLLEGALSLTNFPRDIHFYRNAAMFYPERFVRCNFRFVSSTCARSVGVFCLESRRAGRFLGKFRTTREKRRLIKVECLKFRRNFEISETE